MYAFVSLFDAAERRDRTKLHVILKGICEVLKGSMAVAAAPSAEPAIGASNTALLSAVIYSKFIIFDWWVSEKLTWDP